MQAVVHQSACRSVPHSRGATATRLAQTHEKHMQTVRSKMQEVAQVGVAGPDRMRLAAADWKERMRPQLKGGGSKAKSEGADAEANLESQ